MVLPPPGSNGSPLQAARTESVAQPPPTKPETSGFTNSWRPELGGPFGFPGEELRPRKGKELAQGHTVSEQQRPDNRDL